MRFLPFRLVRREAAEEVTMGSGGARNRSGPPPDPSSGRSDRRGLSFKALPADGWDGPVPVFPLPQRVVVHTYWEGSGKDRALVREVDEGATDSVAARELELWEWAWRTPQAVAWAQPSEAWRLHTIAMWVRAFVVCESSEATAADKNSLHRFADQIGLSPAGLRENGWAVAVDEVAAKAAEDEAGQPPRGSSRARLKVAGGSRQ